MNDIERKSFYSFLALYFSSSLLFILLSGYWYYSAQKNALENITYYKLEHIADNISGLIINAQMKGLELTLPKVQSGYQYSLISSSQNKVYKTTYFEENGFKILISKAPQEHLNIKYVLVKTDQYHKNITKLKQNVLITMAIIFVLIIIVSFFLSKLFMRPVRQKMNQIEQFIQDISHELNTPITALKMSSRRAIQKGVYDKTILTNISISTKQLYSIYQSLAFLNFSSREQNSELLHLKPILLQSIEYYSELTIAKNITIKIDITNSTLNAVESRIELLFSNLISNAIKYSMPDTTITITLKEGFFSIEDEGVGIAKEKLQEIFKLYERSSSLAGGFGVGLSIVKQICDKYDINIDVISELEIGSRFTLKW